tara:strand:- start:1706 stop:1831 length:126 start_codon:yes stop_codon:yes gene_type:complete
MVLGPWEGEEGMLLVRAGGIQAAHHLIGFLIIKVAAERMRQ